MKVRSTLVAIAALVAGTGAATAAPPMDLARPDARRVTVQTVTTLPGRARPSLSEPVQAWYETGSHPGERVVTIPGSEVERVLMAGRRPVAGSFSDFRWRFDAATGHVEEASFSGVVSEPIRIGPLRASAHVSIAVVLSTRMPGGYRRPRRVAGRTVVDYCGDPGRAGCTAVETAAYDPASGWVRANGAVCARWRALRTLAYTSMGRARFAELEPVGTPDAPVLRLERAARLRVAAGEAPSC
ncbi:MAG: hypothetical protein ACQGVC_17785 [Myxococcota bacterium]